MMTDDGALPPGAAAAARLIAAGALDPAAHLDGLLARIAAREPVLRAFAAFDAGSAMAQAETAGRRNGGQLRGVPIAVKDVFDTADLPTAYGSPIWQGHRPRADAAAVALARAEGAVILGKTVTTEFASYTPGPTTNPHDPARTPGGSSSGSAAAVAAGLAAAAFGTQTAGSMIRPAAYCGVVGFKPSFGMIPRAGMKPLAESFDTAGTYGRTVEDAALLAAVAAGRAGLAPDPDAPRQVVGVFRTDWADEAEAAQHAALDDAARRLEAAGHRLVMLPPPGIGWVNERQSQAIAWETARAFTWERTRYPEGLSAKFREICARGLALSDAEHAEVWRDLHRARAVVAGMFARCHVILTPSAPGEAPRGLAATGAPTFNRLWSVAGGPCLSIPCGRGPHGLPLGVQLVGAPGEDARVLGLGSALERLLSG